METTIKNQHGGARKKAGRKPVAIKKRAYFLYFYESEVNILGGWETVQPMLHKAFEQMKKKANK